VNWTFWDVLRGLLNFLAGLSALILLWWGPTTLKPQNIEDHREYVRQTLSYVAIAVLLLRGAVWVFDRYHH
jgi:hypothetical protein